MATQESQTLTQAHGVRLFGGHWRAWNGVMVRVAELRCDQGRVWHDITPAQASLNIMLEQIGGRVEPRTKLARPCSSSWRGEQFVSWIPAAMPVWGYSDGVRSITTVGLRLDVVNAESLLGVELDRHVLETPRLRFRDDRIVKLGALLGAECSAPGDMSSLYGDSLTAAILVDYVRLTKRAAGDDKRSTLSGAQLRRVTEYMSAHLSGALHLSDLAKVAGLSQWYFIRAFKASTGLSPHQWLMQARVARARELLIDSDLSLAAIALETGFSEQSHFTRVFRRIVGTTPAAWQRERA